MGWDLSMEFVFIFMSVIIVGAGVYVYQLLKSRETFAVDIDKTDMLPRSVELLTLTFESESHIKKGWEQHRAGFFPKAIRHYKDALEVEPMNLPALMQLAILHFDKGELKTANHYLQDMLDNPRHYREEKLLWTIVRILSEHKHDVPAMPYMQRLLEIEPYNPEYNNLHEHMQQYV